MSNGARIRVFDAHCKERQELGNQVRMAIREMYERSAEVENAKRAGRALVNSAALLQQATDACVRAERAYDAHVRAHGCMEQEKSASAAT